jgi:hypothetical protein
MIVRVDQLQEQLSEPGIKKGLPPRPFDP